MAADYPDQWRARDVPPEIPRDQALLEVSQRVTGRIHTAQVRSGKPPSQLGLRTEK